MTSLVFSGMILKTGAKEEERRRIITINNNSKIVRLESKLTNGKNTVI